MTVINGYITAANLKSRLGIADTTDDSMIEAVINSVSRWIDGYCERRFYSEAEARYYTPEQSRILFTDDILSIGTMGVDADGDRTYEQTWTNTDYILMPLNAISEGKPYTWLEVAPSADYSFPAGVRAAVKLEGVFGFCTQSTAAPYPIQEACYIQSARILKRKDAPFGIAGVSDLGVLQMVPSLDVDVKSLLDPFRRVI